MPSSGLPREVTVTLATAARQAKGLARNVQQVAGEPGASLGLRVTVQPLPRTCPGLALQGMKTCSPPRWQAQGRLQASDPGPPSQLEGLYPFPPMHMMGDPSPNRGIWGQKDSEMVRFLQMRPRGWEGQAQHRRQPFPAPSSRLGTEPSNPFPGVWRGGGAMVGSVPTQVRCRGAVAHHKLVRKHLSPVD